MMKYSRNSLKDFLAMKKMIKLDFVVVGFPKCGTTSLCKLLGNHKDISIPTEKETCYFSGNFSYGLEWLQRKYPEKCKIYGEACNHYIYKVASITRIIAH